MKIRDELNSIKVSKKVKTSIEYNCKNEDQEEKVFDLVRNILTDNLESFSKITYDVEPSEHVVKVEVSQSL